MNTSFDLDNPEDFVEMCGNGNICPHKPIDIRNISGNQIIKRPFVNHASMLCKNNGINLLSLLTGIHNKINNNMNKIGDNIPLLKNKVNSVINEWPNTNELTYDDLFTTNENAMNNFNYNELFGK